MNSNTTPRFLFMFAALSLLTPFIAAAEDQAGLAGRVLEYEWTGGPFKGGAYRVSLNRDGSLRWEGLAGFEQGKSNTEESYGTARIGKHAYMVSWQGESGYTVKKLK